MNRSQMSMGPVWVDRTSAVFFSQPQPADSGQTRALFAFLEGTPARGGWRSWRSWRSASKFGHRPTTLPSMSVIHSPADRGPTDPLLISVCSELHTYPRRAERAAVSRPKKGATYSPMEEEPSVHAPWRLGQCALAGVKSTLLGRRRSARCPAQPLWSTW